MTQAMVDLHDLIGRTFKTTRNGQTKHVVLKECRRNKVVIQETGERADTCSMPLERFQKFYHLKG